MNRSRNLWSAEEDVTLRRLVEACEKDKVDWRHIAAHLPGRNNKDCRKRWHYRVSASMNLGPWSQSEDELLKIGIHHHGTHWSRVAQIVRTRNGDQCFKRWNDVLDPAIDRSPWTREEDQRLLLAIEEYGRAWKQIVDTFFPGRTGLDAKNRHRQLTRKRKREQKPSSKTTKHTRREAQSQSQSQSPSQAQIQAQTRSQGQLTPTMQSPLPQLTPTSSLSPPLSHIETPNIIVPYQQHHRHEISLRNLGSHHIHDQIVISQTSNEPGPELSAISPPPPPPPSSSSSFRPPSSSSSSYHNTWDLSVEECFGPPLSIHTPTPTTPYSSCSSISTTGPYEGMSQFENEHHSHRPLPPYDRLESLGHEASVLQLPYSLPGTCGERIENLQHHHSSYPLSRSHSQYHPHEPDHEYDILTLHPNPLVPFSSTGYSHYHHHPSYTTSDGIVI